LGCDFRLFHLCGRLKDQSEISARSFGRARHPLRKDSVSDLLARHLVSQDEVLVGDGCLITQLDRCSVTRGLVDVNFVRLGLQFLDWYSSIDGKFNGNIVPGARSWHSNWRRDARRVRNLCGIW